MNLDAVMESIPMPACVLRGGRIVAANARVAALLGVAREELLASADPWRDFISTEEAARLFDRHQARVRGEPVPDDYDLTGRRAGGAPVSARVRIGPFPLAGPDAMLVLCTDESERERSRDLIRGFVDAAVAAQRETTVADLFRVVREKLAELGLSFTLLSVEPEGLRVLGSATGPFMELIRNRWPTWIPPQAFSIGTPTGPQGLLIDDLPGVVAEAFGAARMPAPPSASRAVVASIPVEGAIRYILSSTGEHLDNTVASAFGLFGKQVGAAIDNISRMEQLRRTNRELRAVNEVAFASARLGSGRAMQSALEQLIDSLDLDSAALFRSDPAAAGGLRLINQQGFEPGWAQGIVADRESPWAEAAAAGQPVLFQLDDAGRVNARGRRVGTPSSGTPRLGVTPTLQSIEPPSCIALPLQVYDEVIGVLIAARQGRPLVADDLRLLGTVAAQVAVALQNATLLSQARRRVDDLSLLLELGHAVVGALDLAQVLQVAARVAARVLRCTCAFVLLPDASGETLRVHAAHDPQMPLELGATLPVRGQSLSSRAFIRQKAQWSIDATADERTDPAEARRMGCRSTLAVPLLSHDRSLGVLALIERTERVFDVQDVRLATHAAQLISAALESAELFEHERRRGDEMALLQDLSRATAGKLDQRELLDTALARLLQLLVADAAAVYLRHDGSLTLTASRGDGLPSRVPAQEPDARGRLAGLEESMLQLCRVQDRPLSRALGLPLHSGGALVLGRSGEREFTPDEVRLATGVCAQLSVALDNSRLYAEQRARAEELTLLNEVGRSLAGSLELRPLLQLAGDTLGKLVDATDWSILLVEPAGETLSAIASSGSMARELLRLDGSSLPARVVRGQQALQQPGTGDDQAAELAVPLLARDEALGVVLLRDARPERAFSGAEVQRATAVCRQLALAVLSARLYEDLRTSYLQLAHAQAELIDRERLAALGELSASIAHEVRNPLGVIFNSMGSLRRILRPEGDAALLFGIVEEEADRLNRMVGDLLDYSRPIQLSLQPVQLRGLIDEAIDAARQQAGPPAESIQTTVKVGQAVATIRADPRLLRQALVNLVLNAVQAMPRGGRLTIDARRGDLKGFPAADIAIADTGPGVPAEARSRIWQPFFTTKATGTGLGLAVVKRIVDGHGGSIVLSRADAGAEFRLYLPLEG